MDSILYCIKRLLGIHGDDTNFDSEIIMNINSAIMELSQLGIGSDSGFLVSDTSQTWDEYLLDRKDLESVRMLIYLKVRLTFDPPTSSFVTDSIERQITKLEWRITTHAERSVSQ